VRVWAVLRNALMITGFVLVMLLREDAEIVSAGPLSARGALPFSVLVAFSVVKDGPGNLPNRAESPREFVKGVTAASGLALGDLVSVAES
jgi:hypothetical protein